MKTGSRRLIVTQGFIWAVVLLTLLWSGSSIAQVPTTGLSEENNSVFLPLIYDAPEHIAFLVNPREGESTLHVMNSDGSNVRSLTEGILYAGVPIWSPDGAKIAFENQHIGENEGDIYVMNADGSNKVNITNNPAIDANPSWSPDGSRIVFERWDGGAQDFFGVELYTVKVDGTDLTQLTDNAQMDYLPSWSPDGQKIAFEVYTSDQKDQIRVMDLDGSNVITVTDDTYGFPDEAYWVMWQGEPPAWSPDSSQIAFVSKIVSGTVSNHEIFVVNADGTGLTNLTMNAADDKRPVWSPDGSNIAFASVRDGNPELYVMNADGSNPVRLTVHPEGNDSFPTWSPTGSMIAYYREDEDASRRSIYVMNSDGSGQTRLTDETVHACFPKWAP